MPHFLVLVFLSSQRQTLCGTKRIPPHPTSSPAAAGYPSLALFFLSVDDKQSGGGLRFPGRDR